MRLTWKDALATVVAGTNIAIYVAFTQGVDVPFIDSVRGAAGAILLLGIVGGCALSSVGEEYMGRGGPYLHLASALGSIALITGGLVLIAGSELALALLFYATIALWLMATIRHVLSPSKTETPR
ncbi:hypothetical protein ACIHFD_57035 [Nonomuraea sp. NPDC051941]|uniref:hypothetical protein n=1 Tax=Nonomuraea sp. NPDC051941 TaxID=3364373 RepID=UPI0037C62CBC